MQIMLYSRSFGKSVLLSIENYAGKIIIYKQNLLTKWGK